MTCRLRWRVSVPCPYSTAGTLPSRRSWRAAPLPYSSRVSAAIFTSALCFLLNLNVRCAYECSRERLRMVRQRAGPASYPDLRVRDSPRLRVPLARFVSFVPLILVVLVIIVFGAGSLASSR